MTWRRNAKRQPGGWLPVRSRYTFGIAASASSGP
jgi:hypothetical protein